MTILVLNAGSSSLKWKLFELEGEKEIASGLIEGIGEERSLFHLYHGAKELELTQTTPDHQSAFSMLFDSFEKEQIINIKQDLDIIGHRVVHGGERFYKPTIINEKILGDLRTLHLLAPLHNPVNILGIEITLREAPQIPNVAVFDTAFHHSIPEYAFRYALPTELYKREHIRRYGFHGTSHRFVAEETAKTLGRPLKALNLITLHLGNGASACAVRQGESVDTSMGFTPLEGLIMGTRSGDIDPAIVTYLMDRLNLNTAQINDLLNRESGLKGICNENDLRTIVQRTNGGDKEARLALEMFAYRIKKYIGSYVAVLGKVDAIVFTGGIGEHAALIRTLVLEGLDTAFGIMLDPLLNRHESGETEAIHAKNSRIGVYVVPTDEELEIARECGRLISEK
ncbi:acetate kinase [Sulfurimonas sp. HSL3-7]|uniref:acetate/propionate family kinase n=1 Tax=Sulfonitrofixus jiaomeiensis TaxID=3131938 RepID=UPI0031F7386B